jgi:ATP synthase F1 epsilon subunit
VPIRLEIVTPERAVLTDDVDMVIAPGSEGYLGILPHHTPLLTTLGPGELRIKKGGVETSFAVFGGFMDVRPDRVVILTDAGDGPASRIRTPPPPGYVSRILVTTGDARRLAACCC